MKKNDVRDVSSIPRMILPEVKCTCSDLNLLMVADLLEAVRGAHEAMQKLQDRLFVLESLLEALEEDAGTV